jgi:formylmethanofuran dehydrogenase subunit C
MAIQLSYNADTMIPVEAECIRPDVFTGQSAGQIAKLAVQHGNRTAPLGDFFDVSGQSDDGRIVIARPTPAAACLLAGTGGYRRSGCLA